MKSLSLFRRDAIRHVVLAIVLFMTGDLDPTMVNAETGTSAFVTAREPPYSPTPW